MSITRLPKKDRKLKQKKSENENVVKMRRKKFVVLGLNNNSKLIIGDINKNKSIHFKMVGFFCKKVKFFFIITFDINKGNQ